MSDLTLSVLGMYNQDPTILNSTNFPLPEDVDRDVLLPMILAETAELEVLYPEPSTFKIIVKAWAASRRPSWERMILALDEEYNPLHNYDRHESEDVLDQEDISDANSSSSSGQTAATGNNSKTTAGTESNATTISETSETETGENSTDQVTGFNSSSLVDNTKNIKAGTGSSERSGSSETDINRNETITDQINEAGSSSDTSSGTYTRDRSWDHSRTLHSYGNIGVTTSAQMLAGELDIRKTDIYRIITNEFTEYFCILVY